MRYPMVAGGRAREHACAQRRGRPHSSLSLYRMLFIWKSRITEKQGEGGKDREILSADLLFKWPHQPDLGWDKARSQDSLHVDTRDPRTWAIFLCLPRYCSRKLDWKRRSRDSNQLSNREHWCHKPQLNWNTMPTPHPQLTL